MDRSRAFTEFASAQAEIEDSGRTLPCRVNPDFFFPEEYFDQRAKALSERIAKSLCERCPLAELCRDYAIAAQEDYGIWGGTNARERREARLELTRRQIPRSR
jgi:hypothetical protein